MVGKGIDWRGSSLDDLKEFPEKARATAGKQLRKIQSGLLPDDYKTINEWGQGVIEIRIDEDKNAFRVVYVAKFKEKI